jgi:hypothetical protein
MTVSARALGAVRLVWRGLPERVRRRIEDRVFFAVGHANRIYNDGYPQPAELIPAPGDAERTEGGVPEHERRKRRSKEDQ